MFVARAGSFLRHLPSFLSRALIMKGSAEPFVGHFAFIFRSRAENKRVMPCLLPARSLFSYVCLRF